MTINLYVSKDFQEFFDQLRVVADTNNKSFAGEIGRAVKRYMQDMNNEIEVVNKDAFAVFLKNATKEELLTLSTLICELNNKIIRKCQK